MTAQGFLNQRQRHPVAMVAAISINMAAVTALMLAKMGVPVAPPKIIELISPTPDAPVPEPVTEPPKPRTKTVEPRPFYPDPVIQPGAMDGGTSITGTTVFPPAGPAEGTGEARPAQPQPTPTPLPVLTEAVPLPSAAREFQPPYPSQLLRMGVEGKAVVRVLIGADGRVRQVAIIAADDPLFAEATERQALRKWRFKPATRDGVAVESWKQMTVRFEIRS